MLTLIVDDDKVKQGEIAAFIQEVGLDRQRSRTDFAENLSDAVRLSSQNAYDLIVLDLLLPYIQGGATDYRAGLELLRVLKRDGNDVNRGAVIVGLSAHPEEVQSFRSEFETHGVLLIQYDESATWKLTFGSILRNAAARPDQRQDVDFVIMVALMEEREGLEAAGLQTVQELTLNGLNVRYVRYRYGTRDFRGAIVLMHQMGLVESTLEAVLALKTFKCRIFCMSGICAGLSENADLGQVLIPSPAWEYQAGKWSTNGFQIAPMQIPLRASTRTTLEKICQENGIVAFLESGLPSRQLRPTKASTPALKPFGTGSAVVAERERLRHIQAQHRQVGGIDMEAYGLYFACHEVGDANVHYFAAKSVVDFADRDKGDDLHPYGAYVSARFVIKFLETVLAPAET